MWSRPPCETGRPSSRRSTVTSVVSSIGTASTSSGRTSVASVVPATLYVAASPSEPSAKPITWLPESPMKTAAGLAAAQVEREEGGARERERGETT